MGSTPAERAKLNASGIEPKQAEAIAEAYSQASTDQELITKKDGHLELVALKVMTGITTGGIIALIVKTSF